MLFVAQKRMLMMDSSHKFVNGTAAETIVDLSKGIRACPKLTFERRFPQNLK
jgi:hypothetical protein